MVKFGSKKTRFVVLPDGEEIFVLIQHRRVTDGQTDKLVSQRPALAKLTQSTTEQLNLLVVVACILKGNNFTFKTDNTKDILKSCMQGTIKSSISLH